MSDPLFDQFAVAVAGRCTLVRELGQGGMGADAGLSLTGTGSRSGRRRT